MCAKHFNMLKNSTKLIYFDENNMTLRAFLKSFFNLKIEKIGFFLKKSISYILKKITQTIKIFWENATYYWLINKNN